MGAREVLMEPDQLRNQNPSQPGCQPRRRLPLMFQGLPAEHCARCEPCQELEPGHRAWSATVPGTPHSWAEARWSGYWPDQDMQGRSDAAAGRRVGVLLSPPSQEVGAGGVQDEGGLLECGGGE